MGKEDSFSVLNDLVRNYLRLSIGLASQNLPIKDFQNQLYGELSRESGIDRKSLEHITQPLANLHFFQNRNGRNKNWSDSWIDFSNGSVRLKEKPSDKEITEAVEPFLKMYRDEITNRLNVYKINTSHQQS